MQRAPEHPTPDQVELHHMWVEFTNLIANTGDYPLFSDAATRPPWTKYLSRTSDHVPGIHYRFEATDAGVCVGLSIDISHAVREVRETGTEIGRMLNNEFARMLIDANVLLSSDRIRRPNARGVVFSLAPSKNRAHALSTMRTLIELAEPVLQKRGAPRLAEFRKGLARPSPKGLKAPKVEPEVKAEIFGIVADTSAPNATAAWDHLAASFSLDDEPTVEIVHRGWSPQEQQTIYTGLQLGADRADERGWIDLASSLRELADRL